MFKIKVLSKTGEWMADDSADTEGDARKQAAGWTGQRGQMTWVARIYRDGERIATYRRGAESAKP